LDAGAAKMQFESGVAADIIQVIQALVLAFVAAPLIIKALRKIGDINFWCNSNDYGMVEIAHQFILHNISDRFLGSDQ